MKGEMHLLITPNAEHSLASGIYTVISSLATFVRSIASGINQRPNFNYSRNDTDGSLMITIPDG